MTPPRLIRAKDAHAYLGLDRATFERDVRPYLARIPVSAQGIAYDRLELDAVADVYREVLGRRERPLAELEGHLCQRAGDTQGSTGRRMDHGASTSASEDAAFRDAIQRATSGRRANGQSESSQKSGPSRRRSDQAA